MFHRQPSAAAHSDTVPAFYRTSRQPPLGGTCALARSRYLHDVFTMCERGIWEWELRQFMPPASLREAVNSLLALGLIERTELPVG